MCSISLFEAESFIDQVLQSETWVSPPYSGDLKEQQTAMSSHVIPYCCYTVDKSAIRTALYVIMTISLFKKCSEKI